MIRQIPCIAALIVMGLVAPAASGAVGKWMQFRLNIANSSWEGNPFDVPLTATFTTPTGRKLAQFGFYAGDDTWKVYFMPDETGQWSYETESPDAELDGQRGQFECVASKLPGPLQPAGPRNTRWKLADGDFLMPLIWGVGAYEEGTPHFRAHGPENDKVRAALDQAQRVGATLLEESTVVVAKQDWAADWPADAMPYVEGAEGEQFHLPYWDRLNERLDAIRDRGMGVYVMVFTDDALRPDRLNIPANSPAEQRLFRYIVARMAPYPIVLWDTGIDITEYRNRRWVNSFADWFNSHDPWRHPVSSRHGGGSGDLIAQHQTYDSVGGAEIPSGADLLGHLNKPVPTAHTDHWRVFISRGNWNNEKLRIVVWRCGLSGGQAPFPDYSQGTFRRDVMEEGAAWIGHATRFFAKELRYGLEKLEPADDRITSGTRAIAAANPGLELVAYDEDGGELALDLSGMPQELMARWYNPREGTFASAEAVTGGAVQRFDAPSRGEDWTLHIYRKDAE